MSTSSINTTQSVTTNNSTVLDVSVTSPTILSTTTFKTHLSSQLFLQSASCQAISGTFAWVALLITIHHVSRNII